MASKKDEIGKPLFTSADIKNNISLSESVALNEGSEKLVQAAKKRLARCLKIQRPQKDPTD